MSNKKKAKHQSKKNSVAKNIAGGAVGTIFNVVLIIVAVMLIYYFAVSAYQYGVRIYGEPAISEEPGTEINVTITDGMDFKGIAKQLCEKGLVREERLFYTGALIQLFRGRLCGGRLCAFHCDDAG